MFGIFIGKFQPLHIGHQKIIKEIVDKKCIPVIVICKSYHTKNNLLTTEQIKCMFNSVYPNIEHYIEMGLEKTPESWYKTFVKNLNQKSICKNNSIIFYNNKEIDRIPEFVYKNKIFTNTFYNDIFHYEKWKMHKQTYSNVNISSRNIRKNYINSKHLLDPIVYTFITQLT